MTLAAMVLAGALAGGGLWLIVRGLVATHPSLDAVVANLHRPHDHVVSPSITERLAGRVSPRRDADLAVCDRTRARFARDRLLWAGLAAAIPLTVGVIGALAAAPLFPPVIVATATVLAGAAGWAYAGVDLRSDAERRRRQFRHAVGAYLELVTILIAGGRGVESALYDAVELGRGDAFRQLRAALVAAQARREAPWRALGRLGRHLRLPALEELEASMTLAGESGARIRDTLVAKAKAIRIRDLAELEAEAQARSETMVFPVAAMFAAFLILIGYPALAGLSAV